MNIDSLLEHYWHHGIFRGQTAMIRQQAAAAGAHHRAVELWSFATLAALIDETRPLLDDMPANLLAPESSPPAHLLGSAAMAWRAAASLLPEPLSLLHRDLLPRRHPHPHPHAAAAHFWADWATIECHYLTGSLNQARQQAEKLNRQTDLPPGIRTGIQIRLALLYGLESPAKAIRILVKAADYARQLTRPHDEIHALTYAGLLALGQRDKQGVTRWLNRAIAAMTPDVPHRYATLSHLLLSTLEDPRQDEQMLVQLGQAIRHAAADGDYFTYLLLIIQGSRIYLARNAAADAVAILSHGIFHLRRAGGEVAALPLVAERQALREKLGEAAYAAACEAALNQA